MKIIKKMVCRDVEKKLFLYFTGNLEERKMKYIKKHIDSCESCAKELVLVKEMMESLKSYQIQALPAGYESELHQKMVKVNQEMRHKELLKGYFVFPKFKFAAAAVCLLLVAVTTIVYNFLTAKKYNILMQASAFNVMNINEQGVIRLNIKAEEKMENVTLKIELTNGVRAFKNGQVDMEQKEIIWHGNLDGGENVIAVYVKGVQQGNWQAKAVLQEKEKTTIKKMKIPFTIL
ncbi:MAG: hypothetical protein A2539_09245 [Elusimicrobia bacterium RIFOXYD2_FULL_34_15]|nr:MAG: hypothetical protein A2539_09245 [Elusimicrobia bacterium RIFOXYD2_FULL_34_15]